MDTVPLGVLFGILGVLLLMSAFFSSSETGLLSLDRYRLLSHAREGHRGARRVRKLLQRKDRLLGLILVGNNIANIGSSVIATLISLELLGPAGPAIAATALTIYLLIFAEIAPKTIAVLHPEKIAYPASWVLLPASWVFSPLVRLLNWLSSIALLPLGINPEKAQNEPSLDRNALLNILSDRNSMLPEKYQDMLTNILNLEETAVNDIMVPRTEITNIDINEDPQKLKRTWLNNAHDYCTVYQHDPDNIIGVLDMRGVAKLLGSEITPRRIRNQLYKPHFIPEHSTLVDQLSTLQQESHDVALITDEYGVIQGMVNIQLIWQEVVGKVYMAPDDHGIYPQADGNVIVDGTTTIRDINRRLDWDLPIDSDTTTLNGLLLEHLGELPMPNMSLRVGRYIITVKRLSKNNLVARALIRQMPQEDADGATDEGETDKKPAPDKKGKRS